MTFTVYGVDKAKARRGAWRVPEKTLFLLPLLIILPQFFKLDGVWMSLPTADTIASLMAAVMMTKYMRKFKKQHNAIAYGNQEENNN